MPRIDINGIVREMTLKEIKECNHPDESISQPDYGTNSDLIDKRMSNIESMLIDIIMTIENKNG